MRYLLLLLGLTVFALLILFWLEYAQLIFSPLSTQSNQTSQDTTPPINQTSPDAAQDILQQSQTQSLEYQQTIQNYQDQVNQELSP